MHPALRQVAHRALPSLAADRAIRYERALRNELGVTAVARKAFAELGTTVRGGPFAGMRLPPAFAELVAAPVLKLTGAYEDPLHVALEAAIGDGPRRIVNIGCADGYYAVGLALRLPDAHVRAHDLAAEARAMTASLADLNAVGERIAVGGRLRRVPADADLIVCDVEGAEAQLFAGGAPAATIIVETHDAAARGITGRLAARLGRTHRVEIIPHRPAATPHDLIECLSPDELRIAVDELRSEPNSWLVCVPR